MVTLLDSGKYSDLRIVCREESWNVHRNIISAKSSVFESVIDELPKAVNPGIINLCNYEPKIVEKMLRFIYQEDYDDERGTIPFPNFLMMTKQNPVQAISNGEAVIINIKVLIIAEELGLNDLVDLAIEKHGEVAYELWDAPSFERSIILLYNSKMNAAGNQKLRRVTANIISINVTVLLEKKTFRDVLNLYGELATEVLSKIATGKGWL